MRRRLRGQESFVGAGGEIKTGEIEKFVLFRQHVLITDYMVILEALKDFLPGSTPWTN